MLVVTKKFSFKLDSRKIKKCGFFIDENFRIHTKNFIAFQAQIFYFENTFQ